MSHVPDSVSDTRLRPLEAFPGGLASAPLRLLVIGRAAVVDDGGRLRTQPADGRFIDGLARAVGSVTLLTPIVRRRDQTAWRSLQGYGHVPASGIRVVEVPDDLAGGVGLFRSVRRVLRQGRVAADAMVDADALFVFLPSFRGALAVFLARRRGIPVVVYLGSRWHRLARSTWRWDGARIVLRPVYEALAWLLERWTLRASDGRMLRGRHLMRVHRRLSGPSREAPPIVAFDSSVICRRERGASAGTNPTILYLGALRKVKNIPSILQGMSEVWRRHDSARLLIAGAGPEETVLRAMADQVTIDRPGGVEFLGYVSDPLRKAELLRDADVLVLASFSEGFPRVIHEAFASGVPVVAPDLPEIRSELPRGSASLVDPRDVASIADGISQALDPEHAERMTRIGYAVADAAFGRDPVDVAAELLREVIAHTSIDAKER